MLLPYDKVCQDWLEATKTSKKLPTLDDARKLLKTISEVNNHWKTMMKKTRKIARCWAHVGPEDKAMGARPPNQAREKSNAMPKKQVMPNPMPKKKNTVLPGPSTLQRTMMP
mmetsp:Transcript_14447/g.22288  ORF Transcript_14447/g.22288 Transcript_14447/m.22288 type:complete len:112 (-) Transcript_14447:521-856(-)